MCALCPTPGTINEWIAARGAAVEPAKAKLRAVVVGGGFIGLEMAENLVHRGFEATVVEMAGQVLAPADEEFARAVEAHLQKHGVQLALGDGVAAFEDAGNGVIDVRTKSGKAHRADLVILAIGVRPDTALAKTAGLEIGARGGIRVDDQMRTSDPDIFAVGDAIEVKDFVTGEWSLVALAGPANRQGRIAADVIAGRDARFRGTQGTAIVGLFGAAIAWTGVSEKTLKRLGDSDYEKIYIHPNSHAAYYPGAKPIAMKVLFRKSSGLILGAQAFGEDNVDKRISALAMAIQMHATIHDLEEAELCYAPQFGSAKDPVNFAGMAAANALSGDMPLIHWDTAGGGLPPRRARAAGSGQGAGAGSAATFRSRSFARALASFPAARTSTSSAAPASGPISRRASSCSMASRPGTYRAACSRWPRCLKRAASARRNERRSRPSPCPSPHGRGDGVARSKRHSGVPSPMGRGTG